MAQVTQPRFVSVLLCSGPSSGSIVAVAESDLIHRRKTLGLGAHVLVQQRDGSRRRKGVIVHMNPFPEVATPTRQERPSKRSREEDHVAPLAKRFKPGPTRPAPSRHARQLARQLVVHPTLAFLPQPQYHRQVRFPGRHRVRKQLSFGPSPGLRSIHAPLAIDELDGVVPLEAVESVRRQLTFPAEPLADTTELLEVFDLVPLPSLDELFAPAPAAPAAPEPTHPPFSEDELPLRPAPYSRRLYANYPRVNQELTAFRTEQRALRHDAQSLQHYMEEMGETIREIGFGLRHCALPAALMTPRLG